MKLNYLKARIKDYRMRYETSSYNPELDNLLKDILTKLNNLKVE